MDNYFEIPIPYSSSRVTSWWVPIVIKRVAINGFGRIRRLAMRAAPNTEGVSVVHVNEVAGDAEAAAHLLEFDFIQGRWDVPVRSAADPLRNSCNSTPLIDV